LPHERFVVCLLVHRLAVGLQWAYGDSLLVSRTPRLGAIPPLMIMGREGLLTPFLAAFGRIGPNTHFIISSSETVLRTDKSQRRFAVWMATFKGVSGRVPASSP
jgi:hypothetical protein